MVTFPSGEGAIKASVATFIILTIATPLRGMPQWRSPDGIRINSPVAIRRLSGGDAFRDAGGIHGSCAEDLCRSAGGSREASSRDPGLRGFWGRCTCRCPKKMPAFREDIHACTDSINECPLADFVSSSKDDNQYAAVQTLPLVFLPLKGQILHPSAVIRIDGISLTGRITDEDPYRCTVNSAHFLTRHGWVQLSNNTTDILDNLGSHLGITRKDQYGSLMYRESSTPFGIYEEKGHVYLKWIGELNMRELLGGRMVLVHLSCQKSDLEEPVLQCVGFRVAGTISITQGIREMTFDGQEITGPDFTSGHDLRGNSGDSENNKNSNGLTASEWIAIAAASLFLGAIYVASVFLYLHLKKSNKNNSSEDKESNSNFCKQNGCMGSRIWRKVSSDSEDRNNACSATDGIVKTNPLHLMHQCHQHHKRQGSFYTQGSGKKSCSNLEMKQSSEDSNDEEPHHQTNLPSSPSLLKSMLNIDSLSSDEEPSNIASSQREFHHSSQSRQRVTAALVHSSVSHSSSIERLPKEDVSIVEAPSPSLSSLSTSIDLGINVRTEPPDSLPPDITSDDPFVPSLFSSSPEALLAAMMGMTGTAIGDNYGQSRRKLYFNPAYFEPELLQAPPPAAVEFLSKIREVIALARHRMAAKRFSPSLLGIPEADEEDCNDTADNSNLVMSNENQSKLPSLKRENSRHLSKPRDKAIQKWLESLSSASKANLEALPIKVGPEAARPPPPPLKKKHKAPPIPSPSQEVKPLTQDTKKAMNAVIRELEVRRSVGAACQWDAKNENGLYEVDSLEKTKKPTVGNTLEVITMKSKAPEPKPTEETSSVKLYRLPELLSKPDGYSLVSEVYVNDTYNSIGSMRGDIVDLETRDVEESTVILDDSDVVEADGEVKAITDNQETDNIDEEGEKVTEEAVAEVEIKEVLTITLEDSPSSHRRNAPPEEDNFEMDTLDRKRADDSAEEESVGSVDALSDECNFMDSLERPLRRISLRSSGSFRSDTLGRVSDIKSTCKSSNSVTDIASILAASPLTRAYGSLREVYEARQRRKRDQRRRRTSDVTKSIHNGSIKHHNLSAIPAWRLVRRLPEDDPDYYPYKPQNYSPVSGQTKESPVHLRLLPQDKNKHEKRQQKPSSPPLLLKNHLEALSSPPQKLQNQVELNKIKCSPVKINLQKFSNPSAKARIESPTHLSYFKQDGLYTSPFCDDDDDDEDDEEDEEEELDDGDTGEEDEESLSCSTSAALDSLTKDGVFNATSLDGSSNENIPMLSFLQHLQKQSKLIQQSSSIGSQKERKLQKSLASRGMRIVVELQRELDRAQQRNSVANSIKKQMGTAGIGDEYERGKVSKRTWRRLIEKREKERAAEEETSREVRVTDRLEEELRKVIANDRGLTEKLNQRKDLKFRLEDSGYLSSSDESALGRVSLRKSGHCTLVGMGDREEMKKNEGELGSDSEGESVFDGASESGAESIATDSFFGSFRVFSTASQKADQLRKQRQRCSALFEMISENGGNVIDRVKLRHASEEDASDSESGGFTSAPQSTKQKSSSKTSS